MVERCIYVMCANDLGQNRHLICVHCIMFSKANFKGIIRMYIVLGKKWIFLCPALSTCFQLESSPPITADILLIAETSCNAQKQ